MCCVSGCVLNGVFSGVLHGGLSGVLRGVQEIIVTGPKLEKAMNVFATRVVEDVTRLHNSSECHVVEGITIKSVNHSKVTASCSLHQ